MLNKQFKTITRIKCKASILIEGLSGSGKSGLALTIAKALSKGNMEKVFTIDTENNSLNLFEGLPCSSGGVFKDFKNVNLTAEDGYSPSNYIELRNLAIKEGAETVIFDSISHAWQYQGGVLTMVSDIAAKNAKGDKYAAWRDTKVMEEKNNLMSLVRADNCHMITTVRLKEKFAPEQDDKGKTVIVSLGEQQIMQDDIKYEPDLVLHMITPGNALKEPIEHPVVYVSKSRYPMFKKDEEYEITPELLESLRVYLDEGADPMELLEQQRQDYIKGVTEYIKAHPEKQTLWQLIKQKEGYESVKLDEMPLSAIKKVFNLLTA